MSSGHAEKVEHAAKAVDEHLGHGFGNLLRKVEPFLDLSTIVASVVDIWSRFKTSKKEAVAEHHENTKNYFDVTTLLDNDQKEKLRTRLNRIGGFRAKNLRHQINKIAEHNSETAQKILADLANCLTDRQFELIAHDGLMRLSEDSYPEYQLANQVGRAASYTKFAGKTAVKVIKQTRAEAKKKKKSWFSIQASKTIH